MRGILQNVLLGGRQDVRPGSTAGSPLPGERVARTNSFQRALSCDHPDGSPDLATLQRVADVWGRGDSGLLKLGSDRAVLVYGEPTSFDDLQLIVRAIYAGAAIDFKRAEVFSNPSAPSLGRELWVAATRTTDKTAMRGTAQSPVQPGPLFQRRSAFNVHPDTARFLDQAHATRVRVGDTVRLDKPTRLRVLEDLAVLKALGVIKLGTAPPRSRPAPTRRPSREEPRRATTRARHDPKKLERLERDLSRLRGADDWVVLGCNPSMDPTAIELQCRRLLERYETVWQDARSEAVRDVAKEIYDIVRASVDRVRQGNAKHEIKSVNPQTAAEDGLRLVDQGRFDEAVKAFGLAQQHEPYAPRHQAWLGYAYFHDTTRDLTERQRKGRKLIEKATMLGGASGTPNYVQALMLFEEKDLVRAWNHVEIALRSEPDHRRARELKAKIQAELKPYG